MEPDTASRLCKLLMMTRPKKLHIQLLDQFKWDLGLPYDYVKSLVPNYPDCFRIVKMEDNNPGLELVWWNHDLAFSALEERAMKKGGYKRGMPLEFPMVFPKDMELKHKVRERIAEWQKLPYISPYEDFSRKDLKGDFAERRMVAIMHELLSLMVHKRAPRKLIARLQGPLDLPERFEKSFKWYPGMFYQCTRAGTLNVLLREAFKRDELIDEHPLVNLRGRIMHFLVQGYIKYKRSLMERRPEPEIEKKKRRRGSSLKQKLRNSEHGLSSDDEESAHKCEEESEDEYEEGSEEEGDEMIGTGHRRFRRFETRSYASLNSNVRRDNSPRTRQGDSKRSIRFGREGPRQKTFGNRRGGFQSYPEAGRRRQSSRLGREEWKAIG